MKIGEVVTTKEFGRGVIVSVEHYSRMDRGTNRYGLRLDNNPFLYDDVFFWPHELLLKADDGPAEADFTDTGSAQQH